MSTHVDPVAKPAGSGTPHPLAVVVLAAALALDAGGVAVVNAALPVIGSDLDIDSSGLQWTMTSYAVTFAGFLLFGGRAADVLGRRRVFALGVGLFTAATVVAALAPDAAVLMVARALQGVGAALSGPASLALLTQLYPEGPRRNRALAVYTSVGASSFSAGVVLGGVLTDLFSWRAVFAFNVVIGLAVLLAVKAVLPAGTRDPRSLDLVGAAAVTGGLLLAVYGLSEAGHTGWTTPTTLGSLVLAVLLLVGFVCWELRTSEPLLSMRIFRLPTVTAATVAAVAFFTAVLAVLFFAPLYLQGLLGYTPLQSGLAILPMGMIVVVSSNVAGRVMARVGQKPLLVVGLLLIAAGVGLWALTPLDGQYWTHVFPSVAVMSVGQGVAFAGLTAASLTGVPQHEHGVAGGLNVTAQQLGGSVGVAALVTLATSVGTTETAQGLLDGYHAAYLASVAVLLVAVLAITLLMRRRG
ncbi:MFS transporter [Saccharothrix violaceirubra]|uniref:EmrB/QacA subfamily drug resistance transporter n=1 Tax=Saccharothrix violaceirubra TaxID=413306 RepID=A0A7W7SYS0_9PSEU|nr:MFS transporter [Saccharothrix violaceirubra]MBB4963411.1 EmrB/QacA subfamily drug resistance transporter [Saccharothrix violaceirubra]